MLVARSSRLLLEQRSLIDLLEQRDSTRLVEIEALRQATGGLSLSVKAGWLTGGVGVVLGWIVQLLVVAAGFLVPAFFIVGAIFTAMWTYCMIAASRIDRNNRTEIR